MLVLNLKTVKHSQHITVSAYHPNSDTNYSQRPCLKKIENYQQTTKTETRLTLEFLDFIHCIPDLIRLQ